MTDETAVRQNRILDLQGGQNFREIGGYPTADGRRLRRGLLWRSAGLHHLTSQDIDSVRALGIVAIADLRGASEREQQPTSDQLLRAVRVLTWDRSEPRDHGRLERLLLEEAGAQDYRDAVLELYRVLADDHAIQLRELYEAISEGWTPVLIHCAAGKDRTGVAVGLLLEILGVNRQDVLADYARTEGLLDWRKLSAAAALAGADAAWLQAINETALEVLMRADRQYLETAFAEMERRGGSTIGFAIEHLGIRPDTIEALRERLLED